MKQHSTSKPASPGRRALKGALTASAVAGLAALIVWSSYQENDDQSLGSASELGERVNVAESSFRGLTKMTFRQASEPHNSYSSWNHSDNRENTRHIGYDANGKVAIDTGRAATAQGGPTTERKVDHRAKTVTDSVPAAALPTNPGRGSLTRRDWANGALIRSERTGQRDTVVWQKRTLFSTDTVWIDRATALPVRTRQELASERAEWNYEWITDSTPRDFLPDVPMGYQHINPLPACRPGQERGLGCD